MNDIDERTLVPYAIEVANILYFLKTPRTMSEWQDWLWRRMPRFKAVTLKVPAHAPRIGRWGGAETADRAVLHTDLLTLLVKVGAVTRTRLPHTTVYVAVQSGPKPLDTASKVSYVHEDPF